MTQCWGPGQRQGLAGSGAGLQGQEITCRAETERRFREAHGLLVPFGTHLHTHQPFWFFFRPPPQVFSTLSLPPLKPAVLDPHSTAPGPPEYTEHFNLHALAMALFPAWVTSSSFSQPWSCRDPCIPSGFSQTSPSQWAHTHPLATLPKVTAPHPWSPSYHFLPFCFCCCPSSLAGLRNFHSGSCSQRTLMDPTKQ